MNRIRKPDAPPSVLRTRGDNQRAQDEIAYDGASAGYLTGELRFRHQSGIYGHATVKEALIRAQYEKCAFCESRFTHIAYGDVEHFRPKGAFRQQAGDVLQYPGYYWLVYDWSNLYASCTLCNQRFKENIFPLRDPGCRARSHHDDLAAEEPLLIDPGVTDPAAHISFRKEIPYAVEDNDVGRTTIEVLGLDREELNRERRELLELFRSLYEITQMDIPDLALLSECARHQLARAQHDSAPYAAAMRAAVRVGFAGDGW